MKKVARLATTFGFVALLVWFVWSRREDLRPVWGEPSWELLLIGVLIAISHFLNSIEFWIVYKAMGLRISVAENWMVFTSGLLGNQLPGQMGTLYKFRYMNVVHKLSHAKNGSSYAANLVISLGSSSIVGMIGVGLYDLAGGQFAAMVFFAYFLLGVLCVALMRFSLPIHSSFPVKIARACRTFNEGWIEIKRTPRTAVVVLFVDVLKYLVTAYRFYLAFQLLGVSESYWFFLVVAPSAAIAGIIAFTPGGLGFRELFVSAVVVGLGTNFDTGMLAATTDRGVMLISALVLGGIGYCYTTPRIRQARNNVSPAHDGIAAVE